MVAKDIRQNTCCTCRFLDGRLNRCDTTVSLAALSTCQVPAGRCRPQAKAVHATPAAPVAAAAQAALMQLRLQLACAMHVLHTSSQPLSRASAAAGPAGASRPQQSSTAQPSTCVQEGAALPGRGLLLPGRLLQRGLPLGSPEAGQPAQRRQQAPQPGLRHAGGSAAGRAALPHHLASGEHLQSIEIGTARPFCCQPHSSRCTTQKRPSASVHRTCRMPRYPSWLRQ